ncbi:hypothetical protein [Chryseobacterium sp.]|uniref:hypothetical protein n=1 Tax=Chryseobacterium sp. TaxID=1871047 RepID=UPI0024E24910|nr:hypothetical protein [Chryseobacterium sp.]
MTITDYLQLPLSERKKIVSEEVGIKDHVSLERLKTAIKYSNPLAVSFNPELVKEYWTIKRSA